MNKKDLSGVVVLYNPTSLVLENIKTYIKFLDSLVIVDNSEKAHQIKDQIIKNFKNITYIENKSNLGIAKALNLGAEEAIKNNYKYLLTMDQDSSFEKENFEILYTFLETNKVFNIGLISPYHLTHNIPNNIPEYEALDFIMTSGNIINLNAYQDIKGFNNDLFIDQVDHDFCFRLKENGYKVIRLNKSILNHNLGEVKKVQFLWKKVGYRNHSIVREYYIFRNSFYLFKKYKTNFPNSIKILEKSLIIKFIKIILLDNQRIKKLKIIFRAYIDYKNNKFGKLDGK